MKKWSVILIIVIALFGSRAFAGSKTMSLRFQPGRHHAVSTR